MYLFFRRRCRLYFTGALSDPFRYGDIGLLLGKAIAESSLMTEKKVYRICRNHTGNSGRSRFTHS